jgi:hypothetical protein
MNLPMEAPSDALPKSMLQEVQTIRRWDGRIEGLLEQERSGGSGRRGRGWREFQCRGCGRNSWRGRVTADRKGAGWREARGRGGGMGNSGTGGEGRRRKEGMPTPGEKESRDQKGEAS